jgi:hypothetical protein
MSTGVTLRRQIQISPMRAMAARGAAFDELFAGEEGRVAAPVKRMYLSALLEQL